MVYTSVSHYWRYRWSGSVGKLRELCAPILQDTFTLQLYLFSLGSSFHTQCVLAFICKHIVSCELSTRSKKLFLNPITKGIFIKLSLQQKLCVWALEKHSAVGKYHSKELETGLEIFKNTIVWRPVKANWRKKRSWQTSYQTSFS